MKNISFLFVLVAAVFCTNFNVALAAEFSGEKKVIHPPAFKVGSFTNEIIIRAFNKEILHDVYTKDGLFITFRANLEGKLLGFRMVRDDSTIYISPESGIPGDISRNVVEVKQSEWEIFYQAITPHITVVEPVPYVDVQEKEEWEYIGTTTDSIFDHVFKRSTGSGSTVLKTVHDQDFAFRPVLIKGSKVFLAEYAGKCIPLASASVGGKTNLVAVVK